LVLMGCEEDCDGMKNYGYCGSNSYCTKSCKCGCQK
jgi:hypothetical protein